MMLSDLDGFLTGVAIGPELLPPSVWLPRIWGGDEPAFSGVGEAETILGTIMGRYNEIIVGLDADPEVFEPLLWKNSEGNPIVADWAAGFLDAVKLRPEAWEPMIRNERARLLLIPLLVLGVESDDDPLLFGQKMPPADEVEFLFAKSVEVIALCIPGIRAFWLDQTAKAALRRPRGRRGPGPRHRGR